MIYYLDGTTEESECILSEGTSNQRPHICVLDKNQLSSCHLFLNINSRLMDECLTGLVSKFESHEGFDFISLMLPNKADLLKDESRISIYFKSNVLVFIYEDDYGYKYIETILSSIKGENDNLLSLEKILYDFFDLITSLDSAYLDNFEQEIAGLEEALITSEKKEYTKEIIWFRKKLLVLKRYYEQLYDLSLSIEENENELLSGKMVKSFHHLTNRIGRLSSSTSNLRDYVSQVREAYQAEVDISQNITMRIFTVITAVFLPLTLIVGWYGMNFPMPEYKWAYGYPVIVIISISVALFSIIYFKIKKWF